MSIRLSILLVASLPAVAVAQTPLPADINPVTLSRLPPISRDDLDAEGQRALDARTNVTPGPGPGHITIYSPKAAEGLGAMGRYLGVPRGDGFPLGARLFQLAVLITAREIDQQYEWSAHEPAGLRAGLEQSVIDAVKYDKDVKGLAEKDATLIRFGRTLFREHKVSSELWAKMVEEFGRQRTVEIMLLMGDYFIVGMMMNAVDQHLPPERPALLPPLTRSR
jgi:4-carboxymuconolactone decarboxylase